MDYYNYVLEKTTEYFENVLNFKWTNKLKNTDITDLDISADSLRPLVDLFEDDFFIEISTTDEKLRGMKIKRFIFYMSGIIETKVKEKINNTGQNYGIVITLQTYEENEIDEIKNFIHREKDLDFRGETQVYLSNFKNGEEEVYNHRCLKFKYFGDLNKSDLSKHLKNNISVDYCFVTIY